ncbi:hypothetical protein ACQPW1_00355 [Nocardia sp. CA-128927]|uniref:hypothetical protein n=1 Tax=Nocardia sp. CA-128927 TaxID=3239975 RepID=UPI003D969AA7
MASNPTFRNAHERGPQIITGSDEQRCAMGEFRRLDRYGEPVEPHECRDGWATEEHEDVQRPCLLCRRSRPPVVNYDPTYLSERARLAIEKDNRHG